MIDVALLSVTVSLIAFGPLGLVVADPIMGLQEVEAQKNIGDITSFSEG